MCSDCFQRHQYAFASQHAFELLRIQLEEKLARHVLVDRRCTALAGAHGPEQCLHCQTCQELWLLASPDGAWRGYLLPAPLAAAYVSKLRRRAAYRQAAALALLLAVIAWLVWQGFY